MIRVISVIVVTMNRVKMLDKGLESLMQCRKEGWEIEILVADNSDNHISEKLNKNKYPSVDYIYMNGNKGVTIPRNEAVKRAKGDYLYFMDDDAWVSPNIFDASVEILERRNDIWAVYCRTIFVRFDGTLIYNDNRPKVNRLTQIPENSILVKREVFEQLGGFNERIFFGAEGEDISLRAFYRGYFSVMSMDSIAYHPTGAEKPYNRQRCCELNIATCIATKTTWPRMHSLFRILKIIIIRIIKESIHNRDMKLIFCFYKRLFKNKFFIGIKKDPYINKMKFLEYRELLSNREEIEIY